MKARTSFKGLSCHTILRDVKVDQLFNAWNMSFATTKILKFSTVSDRWFEGSSNPTWTIKKPSGTGVGLIEISVPLSRPIWLDTQVKRFQMKYIDYTCTFFRTFPVVILPVVSFGGSSIEDKPNPSVLKD